MSANTAIPPRASASSCRKTTGFFRGLVNGFVFRSAADPGWWGRTEVLCPTAERVSLQSPGAKHPSTRALGACAPAQQLRCCRQGQLPGAQHSLGSAGGVHLTYSSPVLNKPTTCNFGLITHGITLHIRNSSKQSEKTPTAGSGSSFLPPTTPRTPAASSRSCVCSPEQAQQKRLHQRPPPPLSHQIWFRHEEAAQHTPELVQTLTTHQSQAARLTVQIIAAECNQPLHASQRTNSCPSLNSPVFNNLNPTQLPQHHIDLVNQFYTSGHPGCIETF